MPLAAHRRTAEPSRQSSMRLRTSPLTALEPNRGGCGIHAHSKSLIVTVSLDMLFLTVTHIKKVHAARTPSSPTPTRRPQGLLNELLHTITGLLSGVLNRAVVTLGPKVAMIKVRLSAEQTKLHHSTLPMHLKSKETPDTQLRQVPLQWSRICGLL